MTNAQKTWWVVVVAIVVVVLAILIGKKESDEPVDMNDNRASMEERVASTSARLLSATILMPDSLKPITLSNGRATFTPAAGGASAVEVALADNGGKYTVVKDVHSGTPLARTDVLTAANISFGGTGLFTYLVLLKDTGATMEMKSIALVGDRVDLQKITTDDLAGVDGEEYIVTVEYLDRADGAPMTAEKDTLKKKFFIVENGGFNLAKTDLENVEEGKD